MKRLLLVFLALLLLIFAASADTETADVARIHIIANSDSDEDIAVKMKVSEAVTQLLGDESFDSMDSIEYGLTERLDEVNAASNKILKECGMPYTSSSRVGVYHFAKKTLGNSAFPEGDYLALVVTLGEGRGTNFWSVIFPDISLEASLAMGEQGSAGKTVVFGNGSIVKIRCLFLDFYNYILTKR